MNKERAFITGLVSFLVIGSLLATGVTDGVYLAVTLALFLAAILYTIWCERL